MAWENCSKKGEDCPFHDRYIRFSTCYWNFKAVRFQFIDPSRQGTIQEIIGQKHKICEVPCVGDKNCGLIADSEPDNQNDTEAKFEVKPTVGQGTPTVVHMMGQERVPVWLFFIHEHG